MSYGRSPHYIIRTEIEGVGECYEFFDGHEGKETPLIHRDAMAQFVASMWKHDHPTATEPPAINGELGDLIRRGFEVRSDLGRDWSTNE